MDSPLHWMTAEALGVCFRTGACTPLDVTNALLGRIEALDPRLHAFTRVDAEGARASAEQSEAELRDGHDRGPLHGVPIAVKELCAVRGWPKAAGTRVLRDHVATEDACVVSRLREAGAVILGTLAMTEGAYAAHHPTVTPPVNPWNAERWSGVSSSGSGVATAAGLCVGALGTDTGGSIRFPSAVNGVVGIKPTYGRVPRHGVFPLAESLDHVGPLARSVRDAAAVLGALAGFDARDPTSLRAPVPSYVAEIGGGVRGLRVGVDERWIRDGLDADIADAVLTAAQVLARAGAAIRPVRMPPWEGLVAAWSLICGSEVALAHEGLFPAQRSEYGPELADLLDAGHLLPAVELARAQAARREFTGRLAGLFEEVDLLLSPSLGVPVPGVRPDPAGMLSMLRFTVPFDFSGSPTISLPCGVASDGMPVSLQLVGRHLDEPLLCRTAFAFEQATDWHTRHPV